MSRCFHKGFIADYDLTLGWHITKCPECRASVIVRVERFHSFSSPPNVTTEIAKSWTFDTVKNTKEWVQEKRCSDLLMVMIKLEKAWEAGYEGPLEDFHECEGEQDG